MTDNCCDCGTELNGRYRYAYPLPARFEATAFEGGFVCPNCFPNLEAEQRREGLVEVVDVEPWQVPE